MPRKLLIEALGTTVAIDLAGLAPHEIEAVDRAWADVLAADEGQDAVATVDASALRSEPGSLPVLLADLSQHVTLAAIEARRGELWMLHAAGVAASDGRVVVLVGPSGRGKTTAARTLGAHFGYVSDETVAIDAEGRVWPYRKPLSIIEHSGEPKAQRSPSSLGMRPLPDAPLRLAAIAVLDRREDAGDDAHVEEIDLGDALPDLVEQSSHLTSMPTPLRTIAAHVEAVGGVRRLTYREAASIVSVVGALAERAAAEVRPVGEASPVVEAGEADAVSSGYSRGPVHDVLALDDPARIAVLQRGDDDRGTVRIVAGVAPALWRAADGASLDRLTAAAVAEFGEPDTGDAGELVAEAAAELVEAGILRLARPLEWSIREDVAWTDSGRRVVALALSDASASPLALEGSATIVWRALAEGAAPAERIAERAAAVAGADPQEIADDVVGFLAELESAALIERR